MLLTFARINRYELIGLTRFFQVQRNLQRVGRRMIIKLDHDMCLSKQ